MEKILVVDDSSFVRKSIAEELLENGFHVIFAENGKSAIAKKILELHNGKIWVESEEARGSVFLCHPFDRKPT